ncbi:hypothetical protein F0562_025394 [Nyssa sinensis]|uniref:Uncharacterized protein n=1 Tax=Nyssa sinensis TaxID=561372 RepID=A0A5J5BJT8_9ASTE|nr:hypothetical protein F0562_025394 [Nyssa sinensis]
MKDTLKLAWDLSWDKIPGELAQLNVPQTIHGGFIYLCRALYIMATSGEIRSDLSIAKIATFEAETRHRSEIEAAKVITVKEKNDKILKLRRKLASDGYNLCLKKIAKAYQEVDTKVLDHIEISNPESEEFEDDEDPEVPTAPTTS